MRQIEAATVTGHHRLLRRAATRLDAASLSASATSISNLSSSSPASRPGMPILIDNPGEAGRGSRGQWRRRVSRYGGPCIVVDFGTATTFDVISAERRIHRWRDRARPGISAEALFARAARLSRVRHQETGKVIGTNTVAHIQSGLYYGYIGLVDGILERMIAKTSGADTNIVATGGLARLIAEESKYITKIDDMLTLDGLRLIYERNRNAKIRRASMRRTQHAPDIVVLWKITSTTSRKSKSTFSGGAGRCCCFPRLTGH